MPVIDFYYMPESPPCRAVEMVSEIAGVTLNKHYIDLSKKEQLKEEYVKINPSHKVPFICDGDVKIGESRAIMAYIVNKYMPGNNTLYPSSPEARARIDELLHFDNGTLWQSASKLLRPILFALSQELDAEAEKALRDILELMDKHLEKSGSKFYLGENLTLGDISLAVTLSFISAFDYDFSSFKSLSAYVARLKANIPKYSEINDKPIENLRNIIKSRSFGR